MSEYVRSIRSIERTDHYSPISPVNRYATYRMNEHEQTPLPLPYDWNDQYYEAADGAAEWLKAASDAQTKLDDMMLALGRNNGAESRDVLNHYREELVQLLNSLGETFARFSRHLRPEVWEVVELALRHPGIQLLGMQRDPYNQFYWTSFAAKEKAQPDDSEQTRRLLLGSDGLLGGLKRALGYADRHKAVDLLQLPFPSGYPYAMYYSAMQTYWPIPFRGVLLNKYY